MTEPRTIVRFRKRSIAFHWVHTLAFAVLLVTGAILIFPGIGAAASGGMTRVIHRIAVIFFVGAPVVYGAFNPRMTWHFIKETLSWGKDDLGWLMAAPDYYFGGNEANMPPQEHINSGQKLWQFIVLGTGLLFVITGFIMWFLKGAVSPGFFSWCLVVHDLSFVLALLMLLVHIYTGSLHPRMNESFRSMLDGKISADYAHHHYGKWYQRISGGKS